MAENNGKLDNDPGKGVMFKNRDKEDGDNRPDFRGALKTPGGEQLEIALWKRESKNGVTYLSLNVQKPWEERRDQDEGKPQASAPAEKVSPEPAAASEEKDAGIPF